MLKHLKPHTNNSQSISSKGGGLMHLFRSDSGCLSFGVEDQLMSVRRNSGTGFNKV